MNFESPHLFTNQKDIPKGSLLHDTLEDALKELFAIKHPRHNRFPDNSSEAQKFIAKTKKEAVWVYYPWRKAAVHIPNEELYFALRTARNRNIITEEEQKKYREMKIAIAGLSVGSSILSALVMNGGPRVIKIADFDTIEISNLNRIKATLVDIGNNKAHVAARMAWELDPFATIEIWDRGVSKKNLGDFLAGKQKIDLFIEEMDDLSLKVKARLICRREGIPILMATDNGDSVLIDIERFDLEKERPLFHGIIPHIENLNLENLSKTEWLAVATKLVGSHLSERMQLSAAEIGTTLTAIPQLGTAANVAGSAIAYALRKIANNQEMPSGRYVTNFDEVFSP